SYHRYPDDIALLADIGLKSYRFSIEWARLEPSPGIFSEAEFDHYKRVIACCHENHVAPAVTFFHGTAPRWFAETGGWLNAESPERFARYCAEATERLGDGIAYAFTINEPQVGLTFRVIPQARSYFADADARSLEMHRLAARRCGAERFVTTEHPDVEGMTPQLIAGHEQAFEAIKSVQRDLPTGVTLSITDFQPGGEDSPYLDMRDTAYRAWFESIGRAGDFTGVQCYRMIRVPGTGPEHPPLPPIPGEGPENPRADMQRPEALRHTVDYVHTETNKPVIVTENGLETPDDQRRVWYIGAALGELQAAIAAGTPVLGYFHWSLIDNFEWTRGYAPKFGLASVDRHTFKRTRKPSSYLLEEIARRNAL
ncbi:MAG: glycoside hydrolase family 1 protein, partial [Acidimicrobiales bacterium]|nr:glycoside hydrolase family 1 protein [Acidimicrobiales bacterium]